MKNKLFTLFFALVASMTIANAEVYSGTCGAQDDNLTWSLNTEDSVLTISGTGEMKNYGWTNSGYINAPWYDNRYAILSVQIEDGITSIGSHAFRDCTNTTSIELPNGVISIGNGAFDECTSILSITIPNSVTNIGERAFYDCNIISIEFPNSVNVIGNSAFEWCIHLASVIIPASVTNIGEYAFRYCSGMESIVVEDGNMAYDSRGGCNAIIETISNKLIAGCKNTTIPNNISIIGREAFAECSSITSITIPNSVTSIERLAFSRCTGLLSVTCEAVAPPTCSNTVFNEVDKSIPLYVPYESIASYQTANGWKDFTNIQAIPGTEPCLLASGTCGAQGDNLTWELSCDSVLTINGTGEMVNWSGFSNVPWYSYRSSITSVTIGNSVTKIGDWAFYGCAALTSVTIPNSVTTIGSSAFQYCSGLTNVTIPNSVTNIGSSAFQNCSSLTDVPIPNSITSIEENVFDGCSSLMSIEIPNSVTSIGYYAFANCSGITSVTIPNSVTSIGNGAFSGCYDLTSVTIPNSVTSIGGGAFRHCSVLTSVTIPNSVTSIGNSVFAYCSSMEDINVETENQKYCSVDGILFNKNKTTLIQYPGGKDGEYTIPNSVTSISAGAFEGCSVMSVTISNSVVSIGTSAFWGCTGMTSVIIGNSITSIGAQVFNGCIGLTSVTIPNSVTSIDIRAFDGCSSLTYITCDAVMPPTCNGLSVFRNVDKSIPLYVPYESITAYQAADVWKDFTNILPIPGTEPCLIASGTCGAEGDNLTWELSCDSVLTISGTGEMFDCSSSESIPWNTYASSITSILLEEGITYICNYAFHSCVALTSLTIPRSVTNLGYGLFYNCNNLVDISVDNENLNYSSLDGVLFNKNQTTLVEYPKGREGAYIVPNTVISIGERAFEMCYGLTSIIIPYGTTTIEENAFYLCKNLTSVELPKSITTIRTYAFTECHKLPSIAIPESAIEISTDAFRMCENMVSIDVDANNPLYASEDGVLFNKNKTRLIVCPGGKRGTYVIPESVTSIEVNAFNACKRLSNIEASNNIVSIEKWAFWACDSLMSFTIPIQVTTIGDCTFQNCSTLMSVVIPENVINIGNYVFSNCVSLAEIYNYSLIPQTINNNVFSGVSKSACSLYVPAQSVAAYQSADGWKEFTNILPICPIASGTCGAEGDSTNLVWELSCDSVLTISGTGAMADYNSSATPWSGHYSEITSVVINEGVTNIGNRTFSGLMSLTSIEIPNSVTSIGNYAFCQCRSLTSIEIPDGVTSIGEYAFFECYSLTSMIIPDSVTSIGVAAFSKCSGLTSVTIPNRITSIGNYVFSNCTGLTHIEIPNSVTSIGNDAFTHCSGLTHIEIPSSVVSIGNEVFSSCSSLTSVEIPNSVTSIGNDAFWGCGSLISITNNATIPHVLNASAFGGSDFSPAVDKTTCILYVPYESVNAYKAADVWSEFTNIQPIKCLIASGTCGAQGDNLTWELSCDSVLTISGTGAMANYSLGQDVPWYSNRESITSVIILDGVDSIGSWAFLSCSNLTAITLPESIETIGKGAFYECQSMARIDIPIGVRSIGECAFENCKSLDSIVIPYGVTSIKRQTFSSCSKLTSITIPNSIKSIERFAFSGCKGLNTFEFPDSITSISNQAFSSCNGLTSISIPNSVTYLGDGAFENCMALMSIFVESGNPIYDSRDNCNAIIETSTNTLISGCKNTIIPSNIISIGNSAFCGCWGLISLEIPNSVVNIKNQAFSDCIYLKNLIMHNNVTTIENYAFYNCLSLTSVTLPNSVINIGDYAFTGCYGLTSITCEPVSPPLCGENVFNSVPKSIPLYVPYESIAAYQTADQWSEFTNIQPIKCLLASGYCGAEGDSTNLVWELSCDSVLTISGMGEMASMSSTRPWKLNQKQIKTVIIEEGVTNIGRRAFYSCSNIKNVSIPNSVINIEDEAFSNCSRLVSVTIPYGVTNIGKKAFRCSNLISTTFESYNPPILDRYSFSESSCIFYVPCGSKVAYMEALGVDESRVTDGIRYSITTSNAQEGSVSINTESYCLDTTLTINAIPKAGYLFSQWSDGNTENPRTLKLTQDTILSAEFEFYKCLLASGYCGAEGDSTNLAWELSCDSVLTISGTGAMADWTYYGDVPWYDRYRIYSTVRDYLPIRSIVIEEGVTSVGDYAFRNCTTIVSISLPQTLIRIGEEAFRKAAITTLTIPSEVDTIEGRAFGDCMSLETITSYSIVPPTNASYSRIFSLDLNAPIYIPCGTKQAYKNVGSTWKTSSWDNLIDGVMNYSISGAIITQEPTCENDQTIIFQAQEYQDSIFSRWSDGNTDNPRSLILSQDTSLVAEFEIVPCWGYPVSATAPAVTACDSYYWAEADMTISTSGAYEHTFATAAGCDSIVTLDVTIHRSEHGSDTLFIVQKDTIRFDINDEEMDSLFNKDSKKYIVLDTLSTIFGCDSIVHHFMYEIIKDTSIVIPQDSALNFDDLTTDTITQIVIEPQGEVTVNILDIRVGDVIITSDGMHSGQVHGGDNLHAQHIYMEYILNPWGFYASPDRWYAFAVPFDVDIATGISRTCDNKTLVSGTDFLILEYNGLLRALQGKGWSKKLTGTLEPGNFYMLGIDGNCNHWRFEKKENQPVQGNNHQTFAGNGAGDPAYSRQNTGWNGMGNTQLEYSSMDLSGYGMEYLVTYDNQHGKYVTRRIDEIDLFVGQPFFIQAPGDGYFDFHNNSHPHPMPALRTQKAANPSLHFTLTNESGNVGTDHLYLTLHDDATGTYTIGRDLARMSSSCTTAAQLWCTANGIQLNAHGLAVPASETTVNISLYVPANGEYLFEMNARAMEEFDIELLYQGAHMTTFFVGQPVTLNLNAGTTNDYSLRISRKSPTNLGNVPTDKAQSTKVLIDNKLYILQGGHIYDAQGKMVK